jgi:hypothetical protein
MVQVAGAADPIEPDALLQQVFVDVQQAAAGKDLLEVVFFELVHAGATGDDDRPDVEIVERVGDTVEKHPVVGGDPLPLVGLAGGRLRDSRSTGSPAAEPFVRRFRRGSPGWPGRPARTGAPSRNPESRTPRRHRNPVR